MANNEKGFTGNQADIFRQLETPLEQRDVEQPFDVDATLELRGACATALKLAERRGISRQRFVDEMNLWLPNTKPPVTLRKVNAWMATSKEDRPIPAYVLPAWCKVTQCNLPLQALAAMLDLDLSDSQERLMQQLGQAELERAALSRQINSIKSRSGLTK